MYWWGTKLHFFSSDPGSFLISSQSQTLNLHLPPWSWLHMKKICHIQGESPDPVWASGTWWYFCISQNDIRTSLGMSAQCNTIPFQRCHWNCFMAQQGSVPSQAHTHAHTHTQMRSDKCLLSQSRAPRPHTFFFLHTKCKVTCKYRCAGSDHDDM